MKRGEVLERWTEYIGELFHDNRGQKPTISKTLDGPQILKEEVKLALSKMKKNKAAGPDDIVVEMLTSLEEFGIEKLTEIVNEIYDSGEIPEDLSKSIFIALPKKPGAVDCELHRTISLMSHIIKIILRIIMVRARKRTKPEIAEEQCGFVKDTGTRNAILMIRMLSERAIEMQKDLYMCFIDYTKAFDKVRHEEILKMLESLDLDGKDVRLIRNLYWEQTACMRIDGDLSKYIKIFRGVRQGCVLSPDLFNLYSEMILRALEDLKGVHVGGRNVNNLRYADDTVLIAESQAKLQELLDKVVEESETKGLSINCKKTVCMVVSKKGSPRCDLRIGDASIQQAEKFKYLGSVITSDGRCDTEIKKRIALAKDTFQKLEKVLKNRTLTIVTKKRVLNSYVLSVLLYGSECWTISSQMRMRLEATEMWFYRRMLKISWTEYKSNEEIMRMADAERNIMKTIGRRQLKFLGHVLRKEGLENLCLTGKIEGQRARGKQRTKYLDCLVNWMKEQVSVRERGKISNIELLKTSQDRKLWKAMIAKVLRGHGT